MNSNVCCPEKEENKILSGFRDFRLEDKALVESFTKPWELECSDMSFANLFIWGADNKIQFTVEDEVLYIKLTFKGFKEFFWPPIPKKDSDFDYGKIINRCFDYLESRGTEPVVKNMCEPFTTMLRENNPEFYIEPLEIAWDYVYSREKLAELKGKKLHGKRNHINKFMLDHPDWEYKKITPDVYDRCIGVYDDWKAKKIMDETEYENERRSVTLAINNMEELGLTGGVIIFDGAIQAFTIGEQINHNTQLIHIEKADGSVNGLFPIINREYVQHECKNVEFINREEDMGVEGMRKAKRSYHPDHMVEKYSVYKFKPETEE